MTADTETIREALEEMYPYLERKVASFPDDGFARLRFERAAAALAALGRVEEREAALMAVMDAAEKVYGQPTNVTNLVFLRHALYSYGVLRVPAGSTERKA